jgi:hypothetical protein
MVTNYIYYNGVSNILGVYTSVNPRAIINFLLLNHIFIFYPSGSLDEFVFHTPIRMYNLECYI